MFGLFKLYPSALFSEINVVCEQTISYAEHTYGKLCTAIRYICCSQDREQMIPYAEHTADSVLYKDFFAAQFLAFPKFFVCLSVFLLDNYVP